MKGKWTQLISAVLVLAGLGACVSQVGGSSDGSSSPVVDRPSLSLITPATPLSTGPGVSSTSGKPAPGRSIPSRLATSPRTQPSPVGRGRTVAWPVPTTIPAMPTVAGYSRAKFGPAWTDHNTAAQGGNGCDTRNDVLRAQLTHVAPYTGCKVASGDLPDPYTGAVIMFAAADPLTVQIDHIVPLHYAWNVGAWGWTQVERVRFANDTVIELLAVDGVSNEVKGDKGPSRWLPQNVPYRCTYLQRFDAVLVAYHLPEVAADAAVAPALGCR